MFKLNKSITARLASYLVSYDRNLHFSTIKNTPNRKRFRNKGMTNDLKNVNCGNARNCNSFKSYFLSFFHEIKPPSQLLFVKVWMYSQLSMPTPYITSVLNYFFNERRGPKTCEGLFTVEVSLQGVWYLSHFSKTLHLALKILFCCFVVLFKIPDEISVSQSCHFLINKKASTSLVFTFNRIVLSCFVREPTGGGDDKESIPSSPPPDHVTNISSLSFPKTICQN